MAKTDMTKPKPKKKLMITHGGITHPVGQRCEFCEKVRKEHKKMTKQKEESPARRNAKKILGELSCFIYRSDAHYDRENYEHDLDIIEALLIKKSKGGGR